jgi:hypothetical protein
MVAPIRYLSRRVQEEKIGILQSTENKKVLEVVGRVGIGTTIFDPGYQLDIRGDANVSGILSVGQIISDTGSTFSDLIITGIATFQSDVIIGGGLTVTGVSTFASDVDINASVDISNNLTVDGLSDLDEINVAGLSTFASDVDINASVDISNNLTVDGLSDLDELNVAGLSTFASLIDANNGIDASSVKVEDLTENRVVIAGVGGELEDDANFTFDGSLLSVGTAATFTSGDVYIDDNLFVGGVEVTGGASIGLDISTRNLNVSGVSTFTGAADFNGDVDIDGHTELDDLNVSGVSTFTGAIDANGSLDVDGHTELDDLNVSGVSTFTGAIDANGSLDVDGHTELDDLNVSGVSTFTGAADFNGDVDIDGHTELDDLNVSGVSTFTGAVDANGDLDVDGHTELDDLNVSGVSTFTGAIDANGSLDVDGHTELDDLNVSGVSTLSNVFINGKLGIGTDAAPAGKLEVLGGDADFRENVNVYKDLNIYGNISVAGTTVTLQGETVIIEDRDLILGFTTSQTPNDTTANHGGIAIASTEGSPLIPLYVAGINTLPDTYKQFMWVKSGTYTGLTTDAWISNYAVSIGSTELESGVGLGVGTAVRIYNSGIISATSYYGSGGNLEDIIREKIEGITTKFVDSDGTETTLGDALSVSELTINNDNATVGYITAVGFGSTAIYYFNDPIARGLTTDASINTTGIVTFQSDVNVGLGATLALFDISSGRIGVGTIAPSQTLDVNGNARFRGAIYDNNNVVGGANSILTSTGSGVVWADITTIPVGDANTLDGLDSTQFLRSDVADTKTGITTFADDLVIADKITHQSDTDTAIRFPANDTFTVETAGSERLRVTSTGDVGIGTDNPTTKLDVRGTLNVSGVSTFQGNVNLGDNDRLRLGDSQDIQIYHDGSQSYVRDTGAGNLYVDSTAGSVNIRVNSNESAVVANQNGSVELYYDNSKKFETTGAGVSITGNIDVDNTTSIGSTTSSLSTLTQTAIHTELDIATYRSVEYNIQVTEGTNFHATKILALHNGTTAYHSEYGTIFNNSSVAAFDVDVSGGNLRLLASGASASQTDYVINFVATKI